MISARVIRLECECARYCADLSCGRRHIIIVVLPPEVCDGGESLEGADKDALSPGHCDQCVGGRWGHGRDKSPACCACMLVRASRSGLDLPQAF